MLASQNDISKNRRPAPGLVRLRGAFTLIELLVVVAIIALLISILLPALSRAREIARITVCLANMRTIGQATHQYFNDHNDAFPAFTRFSLSTSQVAFAPFIWGGKTPDRFWDESTTMGRLWYVTADERPLNPYLVGASVGANDEIPVLRDPSDRRLNSTLRDHFVGRKQQPASILNFGPGSAYEDVGTSYVVNPFPLHATNWDDCSGSDCMFKWQGRGFEFGPWQRNMRGLVRETTAGVFSELIFFIEDSHHLPLDTATSGIGAHQQENRFSAGFLDGHAEHREFDPLRWYDTGWKLLNPAWLYDRRPRAPRYYIESWDINEERKAIPLPN